MKTKMIIAIFICSVLFSCATQNGNMHLTETDQAEDLLIVDCLLPAQVRQLGQIATYLTARRAVKTSAAECKTRGGEYVAYNLANYSTALKIWLPKAQAGDPQAQNYVGEIYDKGLGIEPDYEMAQVWYKKAARQGDSKAQMNLGYLYEKGLGVQKNQAVAMEWYAKSSKLFKNNIPYAASLASGQESNQLSAELKLLKSSLKNSQAETKNLKSKLASVQGDLIADKERLALLQRDFISAQKKIQSETGSTRNDQKIALLKQNLFNKTQEIERQQLSVERLEKQYNKKIAVLTEKLAESQKRAERIIAELSKENKNTGKSQIALLQTEAKLAETEKRLLEVNELSHQRLTELDKVRQTAGTDSKSLQLAEQKLKQTQQQIQLYKREKSLLSVQITSGKKLKNKYLLEIADKKNEVDKLKSKLIAERLQYEKEISALKQNVKAEIVASAEKPVIEIIDPPFVLTRGVPMVTLRSVVNQREIVGKVKAPAGLLLLTVNDLKRQVDKKGLFKTPIKLFGKETPIQVVAIDQNGKKASLDFVLSMEKAIHRAASSPADPIVKPKKIGNSLILAITTR